LIQEAPGLVCAIGEVDEEEEAEQANGPGNLSSVLAWWLEIGGFDSTYHSFKDEDPSPACQSMSSVQLHQTKRKDTC
jgi:hypothetical protein